jgi:hypothetical protein
MNKGRWVMVEEIPDRWRIDDEWWRKELARCYYQVRLRDGRALTIFHDLIEGGWFVQTVGQPRTQRTGLSAFAGSTAIAAPRREQANRAAHA